MNLEMAQLVEQVKIKARLIVETNEEHMPIVLILSPNNQVNLVGLTGFNERVKEIYKEALPKLLQHFNAIGYIQIFEGWQASVSPESETCKKLESREVKISELPPDDKQEILILTYATKNEYVVELAKIDNTPQGRKLREWVVMPGKDLTGRMIVKEW